MLNWLIAQKSTAAAVRFFADCLRRQNPLLAPPLLFAESTSVLRRFAFLAEISHEEATTALEDLFALPIAVVHRREVYIRAFDFARRLGQRRAYDVQYMAVADLENATIVTADGGMYNSCLVLGVPAHLLE